MAAKIPTTVVTGFLGAGKTTLIRHIIETAGDRRIGLIVNEFGDLGFDGDILRGCNAQACREEGIIELSNGCICCSVADDFVPAMERLIATDPDQIIIETSGLALPQPLLHAFNWPDIVTRATVDGVVAVVDGAALAQGQLAQDLSAIELQRSLDETMNHESPLEELLADQINCADIVIVNKSDLVPQPEAKALREKIMQQARSGVSVLVSTMGRISPDILFGIGMEQRPLTDHAIDDHDHDDFASTVLELPEIRNVKTFTNCLRETVKDPGILRIKGIAAVRNKPMRWIIQAVGPRLDSYFDRPFAPYETRVTRLVVIGEAGLDFPAIEAALQTATG